MLMDVSYTNEKKQNAVYRRREKLLLRKSEISGEMNFPKRFSGGEHL